jgi:outer membrane lipoprotein-sorting protein
MKALLLTIVVALSLPLRAQTAEEIVAKSLDARGGLRKLKAVQSVRLTGQVSSGDAQGTLVVELKRPGKMREEITVDGKTMIRTTNGTSGWVLNALEGKNDPEPMDSEDMKAMAQQADFDRPLVDYRTKGIKIELVGHEQLEDKDTFKLRVTLKDGQVRYDYIGASSFLELKWEGRIVRAGQDFHRESFFRDYRSVEGIMFPFTVDSDSFGSVGQQKIVFEKIELNPPIDDSRFEKPEVIPAAGDPK